MNKIPVWIDTDCGVDDALALLIAMSDERLHIVGMSAVAGNVELKQTFKNTRNVVHLAEKSSVIKVYKGANKPLLRSLETASEVHGDDGLGGVVIENSTAPVETVKAIDALYEAACLYEHELEVVAIGPLTNIAATILKYPDFKNKVKRILFMGGAVVGGNTTPCAEFNAYTDPEAMEIVLNSSIPLIMFGLDCTMKTYFTEEELEKMRGLNRVCDFVVDCSQDIISLYEREIGQSVVILHDSCPIIYLSHPEYFSGVMAGVHCETQGDITRGKTVADIYTDTKFDDSNCYVMLDTKRELICDFVNSLLEKYNTQA